MTYKEFFEKAHTEGYEWAEKALAECKDQGFENQEVEEEEISKDEIFAGAFEWNNNPQWHLIYRGLMEEEENLNVIKALKENAQYFLDKLFEIGFTTSKRQVSHLELDEDIQIVSPPLTHHEVELVFNLPYKVLLNKKSVDYHIKTNHGNTANNLHSL